MHVQPEHCRGVTVHIFLNRLHLGDECIENQNVYPSASRMTCQFQGRVRPAVRTWEAMRLSLVKGAEGLEVSVGAPPP